MPPPAVSLGMELRVGQRGCDAPATADSELSLCLEPVTRGHSSVSLAGPPGPSAPSPVPHAASSLHEPHTSICSVKILQVGVPRTSSCPRGRAAVRLASCDRGGGRRRGSEALGPGPLHSQPNGP